VSFDADFVSKMHWHLAVAVAADAGNVELRDGEHALTVGSRTGRATDSVVLGTCPFGSAAVSLAASLR
jgi:hypothetical protein